MGDKLSSGYNNDFFRELRSFEATSLTGILAHGTVSAFFRWPQRASCGSTVLLIDSVGRIELDGESLVFGGTSARRVPGAHSARARRALGARPARYLSINYPDFSLRFTL